MDSMIEESKQEAEVSVITLRTKFVFFYCNSDPRLCQLCQIDKKRNLDEVDEVFDRDVSKITRPARIILPDQLHQS